MKVFDANPEGINAIDIQGNNSLHDAARFWNVEAVQRLLNISPGLATERNFRNQFPIHRIFSIIYSHETLKIYQQLHSLQALVQSCPESITYTDENGRLPLHLSILYDSSYDLIEYIYNTYPSGAIIQDKEHHTPLDIAKQVYTEMNQELGEGDEGEDGDGSRDDTSISTNNTNTSMIKTLRNMKHTHELYKPEDIHSNHYKHHPAHTQTLKDKTHKVEKFVLIQNLLLSAHPVIRRVGASNSFARFSIHK